MLCASAGTSTASSTPTTARPSCSSRSEAEGTVDAAQLAADGDALLAELPDGWLCDQVKGCATYARVLAGDDISYVDEVEGCYGVRPELVDTSVYEAAHAQLDELLPGDGSLFERRQALADAGTSSTARSPSRC